QCENRIRALSGRSRAWEPYLHLAEGFSAVCSDDLEGARAAFEAAVALTAPRPERPFPLPSAWCLSVAGLVETLVALNDFSRALETGERALATCRELDIGAASHGISRAVAVAEAKLGAVDAARSRVDTVIREQT